MTLTRTLLAATLPLLGIGLAVARGKKAMEAESPPVPAVIAEPASASPAEPAPGLFPAGLPVVIDSLPPGVASLSAQSCNACHWTAHDTWDGSAHAVAWTDPLYQQALRSAGNSTACLGCHLPVAAQHDRLANGYVDGDLSRPRLEANASFDATLMSEGVTCVACHVREGKVLGTFASHNAPHPLVKSDELSSSALCATCHQLTWPEADRPFYDTYGEWESSAYAKAGVDCLDCHMAPVAGVSQPGVKSPVNAHASATTLDRALTTLVSLPAASLQRGQPLPVTVTLLNSGAGHSVPTGNPFKSYAIEVVLLDAAGKDLAPAQGFTLARTVESAPPWRTTADERLPAGGKREWTGTITPSAKGVAGLGALVVRARRNAAVIELRRIPLDIR
ncbi:MAG: hypothetical protein FJ090_16835 [Deltaproteobacteria bacterium]|nr:hypothetical protein [Deltaproteobacteria bacterium]